MTTAARPRAPAPKDELTRRTGSRTHPWRPFATALVGLVLAALVNAEELVRIAERQPLGWRRDAVVEIATTIEDVADDLGVTELRRAIERLVDREPAPPTAAPTPAPVPTTGPPSTNPTSEPAPTTAPTTAPERRRPTAESPLRLAIVGDSMMHVVGQSLVNVAGAREAIAPTLEYRVSTGLTRPDYFDWPARLAQILADDRPEAVVVMFGANDAQGIITPTGAEDFGTEAWLAEYRARTAAVMDLLAVGGRRVYWVGQPIMRASGYSARMAALDEIYRSEAGRRTDVVYVDSWSVFAVDGAYSAYIDAGDGPVLVRQTDGIHLTRAGGDLLAGVVFEAVLDDWLDAEP